MILPSSDEAAEAVQPCEQPLHLPAAAIAAQWAVVLSFPPPVRPVWSNEDDPLFFEPLIQLVRIVGAIANHPLRPGCGKTLLESDFDKFGFMWRSACNPGGDRKTMAVCNCHDLGPLPRRVGSTAVPPFSPGKGGVNKGFTQIDLPTSQQVFTERPQKAFQNSCPLPSLLEAPMTSLVRAGKSFRGAPVRRIHSTPLSTCRASLQRPSRPSIRLFCCHSTNSRT